MKLRCRIGFHAWPNWSDLEQRWVTLRGLLIPGGETREARMVQTRTCPDCHKFDWRSV